MADHPTKDELSGFVLGTLPPEATEAVAEHLEQCSPCQETAHRLDAHKDTLQQGLRRTPPPPVDESCRQAVEKVAAIPSERKADPASKPLETTSATIAPGSGITKEQFLKSLQASGLFSADELRDLADSAVVAAASDGAVLARKLVEQSKLTKFQAQHLYQGKTRGFVFGEYVVLDRLGAGGMGQVYKARHRRMDRIVALKVISSASMKSADTVKRFQREVRAAAKLVHPNIVMAHDAGEQDGVHFLVMEYVEGQDLSIALKNAGPLPVREVVDAVLQAARGLAFAHAEGVVHRDIKPANLLRDKKGTVKILDMGLARFDDPLGRAEDDGLTQSGQVMGTVDYMAPEQAFNTHDATTAADVYSLGCTLYRLLTGQPVFEGKTVVERIIAHRENPAPSLAMIRHDAPAELVALFEEMVAKSPADRPAMSQVVARLESLRERKPEGGGQRSEVGGQMSAAAAAASITIDTNKVGSGKRKGDEFKASPERERREFAAVVSARRGPPRSPRGKWIAAAAGGAALVLLLAGVIFKLQTSDGTLVVEINQPDAVVEVFNEQGEIEITQSGGAGKLSIGVDPGKHRLKVTKDGFQFFAQDFTMESGGEESITATLTPVKAAAVGAAKGDPDRRAAEWIIGLGGYVLVEGGTLPIKTVSDIPKDAFKVTTLDARDARTFDDDALQNLEGLSSLRNLCLVGKPITERGAKWLEPLSALEHLDVGSTQLSDEAMRSLAKLPKLNFLQLSAPKITDIGMEKLSACTSLKKLELGSEQITDATLLSLSRLPNLTDLSIVAPGITDQGIAHIQRFQTPNLYLHLISTRLTDRGLREFAGAKSLRRLSISDAPITDGGLANLHSASQLTSLYFAKTQVTSTGLADLQKVLPKCNVTWDGPSLPATQPVASPTSAHDDYALAFDGVDDVVRVNSLRYDGLHPVTVEAWLTPLRNPTFAHAIVLGNVAGAKLQLKTVNGRQWEFLIADAATVKWIAANGGRGASAVGRRDHVAGIYDGRRVRLFVNGNHVGDADCAANGIQPNGPLQIGLDETPALKLVHAFPGVIDELRVSKTARYDGPFSPSARFASDADTLALYHFDEGTGDVLKDSSGNSHHGKIVGAKWVRADGTPIGPVPPLPSALSATTSRPRLRMDGDDLVEVPTLKLPHQGPLTLEGYFTPDLKGATNTVHGIGSSYHGVFGHQGWKFMWSEEGRHIIAGKLGTPMEDRRTHVAGVLVNGELRLFVDGKLMDRQSDARNFSAGEVSPFEIGGRSWRGVIDEVRVSSVARYDQDFVPAERFEPDAQTLALYHFDEGTGDVLKDSSGNNHHGKIVGAKWVRADGSPILPQELALNITNWSPVKWTEDALGEWRKTATPTESVALENGTLHLKSRNNHVLMLPKVQGRNVALKSRVKVISGKPSLSVWQNSKYYATYYHGASYSDNLKGFGIGAGTIPPAAWNDLAVHRSRTVYTDWYEWIFVCRDDELQVLVNGQTIFRIRDASNNAAGGLAVGVDGEALFENVEYAILDDVKGSVTSPVASGRNPMAAPPPATAPFGAANWSPLFNGKDLAGWKTAPDQTGDWRVENGVLRSSANETTYLFSERDNWTDFHLRCETRVNSGGNGGISCRTPFDVVGPDGPRSKLGYLAKINANSAVDPRKTGSLYVMQKNGYREGVTVATSAIKPDEWFTLDVIVEGNRVVIQVNGLNFRRLFASLNGEG